MVILPGGRRIDCGSATPHVLWYAALGAPGVEMVSGRLCGQRHGTYLIRTRVRDIGIVGDCDQSTGEAAGAGVGAYGNFGGIVGCSLFWVGTLTGSSGYNTVFSRRNSTTVNNDYYGGGFALNFSGNLPRIWIHTAGVIEQVTSTIPITYGRLATIVVEVVSDGVVFYVNGRREKVATTAPPLTTMGVASVISAGVRVGASSTDYDGHRYARHIGAGIFTGYLPDHVKLDGRVLFAPRDDIIWIDAGASGGTHSLSGTLSGGGAAITGTLSHKTLHAFAGALAGSGATVTGALVHPHILSSTLTGGGSTLSGAFVHPHLLSAALASSGATMTGTLTHTAASHALTASLAGGGATLTSTLTHKTLHQLTGALAGGGAALTGTFVHPHLLTGALSGGNAIITGSLLRSGPVVSHALTGALSGGGAALTGAISRSTLTQADINAIATAVWAEILESSYSSGDLLRLIAAMAAGKVSGAGTGTEVFRDASDTKTRITATVDAAGNRTAISIDAS